MPPVIPGGAPTSYTVTVKAVSQDGKGTFSKTVTYRVVEKPTLPTNTNLTLGSIACGATTLTVGNSTTCSISPSDPDGISSITAKIDGVPLSVTISGATYSVTLPNNLTVGAHSLVWTGVGKNPDGSLESPTSATQSITINNIANTAPTAVNFTPASLTA